MRDYKKYNVWEQSHKLTLDVYRVTKKFPKEEVYGLTSQLRRAMLSVPTNISEGAGRHSDKEFANFLNIASGSAAESNYLLEVSKDLNYITKEEFEKLDAVLISIRKMLNSLQSKIRSNF
ncbi:four helix bundle protein [Aquimarina agarivorans]|uniref:four helix bundle protein n=1 Tax=Aquimarina agarivorans TaxID=980584 RepID=UPI000248EDB6|nr:four helix bundle protein [Aquimarina agarivorans]